MVHPVRIVLPNNPLKIIARDTSKFIKNFIVYLKVAI